MKIQQPAVEVCSMVLDNSLLTGFHIVEVWGEKWMINNLIRKIVRMHTGETRNYVVRGQLEHLGCSYATICFDKGFKLA